MFMLWIVGMLILAGVAYTEFARHVVYRRWGYAAIAAAIMLGFCTCVTALLISA